MKLRSILAALTAAVITAQTFAQSSPDSQILTGFAPIDGVGNNLAHPAWGSAGTSLLRLAPAAYADGVAAPSLPNNLSARLISNLLNDQADLASPLEDSATVDQNSLSDFGYVFGQFIDHDMDLTPDSGASFPIPVAPDDPIGPQPLAFFRSLIDPTTGVNSPAQQINVVTSYLDLSQVYGSSQTVADALRTFHDGLLKTSPGNMLPYVSLTYFTPDQIAALNMANDAHAVPESDLFATGDRRGNENIELTALETLFVRNHNRLATLVQARHSNWSDEQLYQEARKLNIAQYQNVIYSEWIPSVLGSNALTSYRGYNPNVNAAIANEFSTVAFRFGHSMLSGDIERKGNDGQEMAPEISLAIDFFDPYLLNPNGVLDPLTGLTSTDIGPILKADADALGQAMDTRAVSEIRNLLFGNGGMGGEDLMARDVQRARDNGIPDYNTVRIALKLPPARSFADVIVQGRILGGQGLAGTEYPVRQALIQCYPGGLGTLDVFEGGLCERHVRGSDVGPTFQAIMVDQFQRLRDGDRFFYLNESFDADEAGLFAAGNTLGKIIMAVTDVTNLQDNVMVFRASISGTVALQFGGKSSGQNVGAPGMTVELRDLDGELLATTRTDRLGRYHFNELSGPAGNRETAPGVCGTGVYKVALIVPRSMKQLNPDPIPIQISHGDTDVTGADFLVAFSQVRSNPGGHGRR